MEDKDKKSLFKKISDKWAQARYLLESKTEMVKEKLHNAKENIKEKFSKTKTKIVVRVASLVLTGAMAASMASCSFNSTIDTEVPQKESNSQYETIINQEGNQNNPGYTIPGENNNDITHGNNSGENNLTETEQQREYTEALQYVLNNPEYNALIAQVKREASINNAPHSETWSSSKASHRPYGFFEKQGFDIDALKNGSLEAFGAAFTKQDEPNNLYVCASAEKAASTPYLTQYILKYELTDQEMKEYKWLNSECYMQAMFMVDAYSQFKTPEIVNESKITTRAYYGLFDSLSKKSLTKTLLNGQGLNEIVMLNFSEQEGKAQILLIGRSSVASTIHSSTLNVANISNNAVFIREDANGAYDKCYSPLDFTFESENNKTSSESVTTYHRLAFLDKTQELTN